MSYKIITDSTSDMPEKFYVENNIEKINLNFTIDGKEYGNDDGEIDIKAFYDKMRGGAMPITSQINPETGKNAVEKFLKEGQDVLYISFSSGLSGSYNSVVLGTKPLIEQYPERKFRVVDSLCASMGEGLLVYYAVLNQKKGMTLEENADWLLENRNNLNHYFTVSDLDNLCRGGRISKTVAFFGKLLNIKPVMHVNEEGRLIPHAKVRGRKKSIERLVDDMLTKIKGYENEIFFVSHGDSEEDAMKLVELVKEKTGIQNYMINPIGPVIGTHSGPDTLALFFLGDRKNII